MRAIATLVVTLAVLLAGCGSSSAPTPSGVTPDGPTVAATPTVTQGPLPVEQRFSPVVLAFQGGGDPGLPADTISQQGFELVVGASVQDLELLESITALLPGGSAWELRPSAEITGLQGPSAFWGLYGTNSGLPAPGDIQFTFSLKDGMVFDLLQPTPSQVVDIPREITVTRTGDDLRRIVASARDRLPLDAQVVEFQNGGTARDTFVACETGDPTGVEVLPPQSSCTILDAALTLGQEYLISLGAFSHTVDTGQGRSASFSGNHSAPFVW